eukprot:TRINITY_DN19595_c0_g1_i1.p1 TRINITY_DN19595_c0_g1~~TRINITY_DN19595_c0_g1_i1.p1  ORF type:complete len:211 (+),score=64.57 TRINITY_DN19595_c0_g1_i1:89-634(+)
MVCVETVPVNQIENCQRLQEKSKELSALRDNIQSKGANAYYHAHGRHFEIPEDAKIVSGPGLVTGGPPQKLEGEGDLLKEEDKILRIKQYSWADCGEKVKVYIPMEDLAEGDEERVSSTFEATGFCIELSRAPLTKRLKLDKLKAEIKAEECKVKVEVGKKRMTAILVKKRESTWYDLLKN